MRLITIYVALYVRLLIIQQGIIYLKNIEMFLFNKSFSILL